MRSMIKKDTHTCISCGYQGKNVEAGGIYFCPNPICTVSGAAWSRSQWPSFKENPLTQTHTVDPIDAVNLGRWILESPYLEPLMRYAIEKSLTYWALQEMELRAQEGN